jgi:hypothetical protein
MTRDAARLEGKSEPYIGTQFLIDREDYSIGRAHENALTLNHKTISAQHAVIKKTEYGYNLIDQNSTNGTFVNDRKINSIYLKNGDTVRFDTITFEFQDPSYPRYRDPEVVKNAGDSQPKAEKQRSKKSAPADATLRSKPIRNGYEVQGHSWLGLPLALTAAWLIIIVAMFTAGSHQFGTAGALEDLISYTWHLPLMHTHFYFEVATESALRAGAIIGLGVLLAVFIGTVLMRVMTRYTASYAAFLFSLLHGLVLLFLSLLAVRFDFTVLERETLRITNLAVDGTTAVILVYIYAFFVIWVISLVTAALFRRR